jgi:hypothetical protein
MGTGIVGFFLILAATLSRLGRFAHHSSAKNPHALGRLGMLVTILVHTMTDFGGLGHTSPEQLLLFCLVAIGIEVPVRQPQQVSRNIMYGEALEPA